MNKWIAIIACIFLAGTMHGQRTIMLPLEVDTIQLKGRLTLPDTGSPPYPAVVIVHGSGPTDMDGTFHVIGDNPACLYPGLTGDTVRTYSDLATGLAKKGIAVYRFQKRSTRKDLITPEVLRTFTPYVFIEDAVRAVETAAAHPELDKERIFLLGHSQGASFLPYISRQTEVRGMISAAGAYTPIDSLYREQVWAICKDCGTIPVDCDMLLGQYRYMFSKLRAGEWPEEYPIEGVYPRFWRDWIGITDSIAYHFNKLERPLLIVQGEEDFNVPVREAALLEQHLDLADMELWIAKGINHLLTPADSPRVSPILIDKIADWIGERPGD